MCDALSEADSENPELLIDCAQLTGAARIALGPEVQAFFCDDDNVASTLHQAGAKVGDPMWRLPIWRPYRKLIDGKCADLNNVAATPFAGSVIAALYLAEFVSAATAWVHVDLMAANVNSRPGGRKAEKRLAYARCIATYGIGSGKADSRGNARSNDLRWRGSSRSCRQRRSESSGTSISSVHDGDSARVQIGLHGLGATLGAVA